MEPTDLPLTATPETTATGAATPRMGIRRIAGSLVLAAGLLGVGGASVVLAASPSPSASTTPSTTQPSAGSPQGGAGGCTHSGSSSSGSSSPSSSG